MVKVRVGQRVVRGPMWSGGNEDGGEAGLGTVIDANDGSSTTDSPSGVRVRWDSGEEDFYAEERALRVVDPSGTADAGVIHISSSDEQDISEGAHRQVLSPEAKETEKKFGKKGEPPATQQVSHTSRPNRLRVPPGRSGPRPIARPACKFSVPYKSSRQDNIDVRDAVRSDKAEETVTTDNHSHTSASRMVYDLNDDGSSSVLPNISGVASVARSESEHRAFKSSPIAILSPGKKMPGHSDPKATEVTERTTAHTVDSLLKVEYVDITNTSHIEAPDTPVTPASTASTLGVDFNQDDVSSEASHQHDVHRYHLRHQQQQQQQQPMNRLGSGSGSTQSSNRSQVASSHMNQLSHPNSSNQHVHQAVRAVPTSGGMISDYGDGEEFKPEQLRSLVNSFACQSDNSPAIRLVKAIRSGSIESARSTFLELSDSLNVRVTHQQLSCAHIAVLHGSLPMLQVLISCGADMTVADWIGNTPLHFAAHIGSSPIIHELITNSPAEIDVLNLKLVTALHIAALEGQHEAVQQLLVLDANVNLKDCEGNTPLHNAAWSNHVKILEMLLDAGADMSITNEKTFNVVHHACYQGNSWAVLRLLRRRPEMVNSTMEKGMYSPLHIAANNNHYSTAEVLLKEPLCHKAAVDHNLHTPLMLAVRRGVKACTELLVAFGADLEMQDQYGSTVLHLAVDNLQEDTRVKSSFIEIDVDESGERSPHINQIQMSIASGNPIEDRVAGIACFLVQCSVMKQNWHNQTPLDICFEPRVAAHLRRFDQRRGKPKVCGSKKPRAKGDDSYLVPFALLRTPDGTILKTMRKGPQRRIAGHESKMMFITTCDMPLLFKLHPDHENMVSDDDPDMALPHNAFLRLIIRLIRKWKMVPRRALELQYNSAWMTVPNESINLNGFDKCSVSVFLAHYEVSGAILFTVFIEQGVETFKPDHVTSQEGRSVKIAEVLCRIRTTLTDFVRQLHGSERVCPKLFYLPIPPLCNCSQDAAGDDLGNASWKIRVKGEEHLPSNPPCACDKTIAIPVSARAWFDKTSRFELVQSNKEAQQQYQDFMKQQIKKQCPLTDLWKSPEFLEKYGRFVNDLPLLNFRVQCKGLISGSEYSLLMTKERDGQAVHNEYLIKCLEIGGTDSFLSFCEVLRKMGPAFEPDAKAMEDVAQRHTNLEL